MTANKHLRFGAFQKFSDISPDGFFIADAEGVFREVNPAFCELTGYTRDELLTMSVSNVEVKEAPEETRRHIGQVIASGKDRFETIHRRKDGSTVEVEITATCLQAEDEPLFIVFVRNLTERKEASRRDNAINSLHKLSSSGSSKKEYLDAVVEIIRGLTGCRCVGIRILDKGGNIPYESYIGFSREFWESENWLSVKHDQCVCIRAILGKPEPEDAVLMTQGGSFRCENLQELFSTLSPAQRSKFRGRCVKAGFASIAVVPIHHSQSIFGAIHISDEREEMFSPNVVDFIESMSPLIGEAVHRFNVEEELRQGDDIQSAVNSLLYLSLRNETLEKILNKALDITLSISWLSFESRGCIFAVEDEPDVLVMKTARGDAIPAEKCARVPFGRCLCGRAALTRKVYFADHVDDHHEVKQNGIADHGHYCVPILFRDKAVGVINVYLRHGHRRRPEEEDFLVAVANTLSGIIVRKKDETEKQRLEQRYQELVEGLDAIVWEADFKTTQFTYVNAYAEKLLGYPLSQWLSEPTFWHDHIHPEDRERTVSSCREASLRGENHVCEYRTIAADGRAVWLRDVITVELADGKPVLLKGVMVDITDRKLAEEALKREQNLFTQGPAVVFRWVAEEGWPVEYVSSNVKAQLGIEADDLTSGKISYASFIYPEDLERVASEIKAYGKSGATNFKQVYRIIRPDGQTRWVDDYTIVVRDTNNRITHYDGYVVDITDRKHAEQKLLESHESLRKTLHGTISALSKAGEMRDPYTAGHQQRVAQLACAIAREMGLPEERMAAIQMAGVIHDIGKLYVPAEILSKPGRLNDVEFALIRTHSSVSFDILKTVEFPWPVASIALQHHERMNGTGYPCGLKGEQILAEARILAVADVVEAMASHRPYRPALGIDKALEEIAQKKGVLYDPEAVYVCVRLFTEKGFRFDYPSGAT